MANKKTSKKFHLISLINADNKKLESREIENFLLTKTGKFTTASKNLGFRHINFLFDEKTEKDKYSLGFEIALFEEFSYFLVGQSGLFLKTENTDYFFVEQVIERYSNFIGMCRLCLYNPIGVIHLPDGDSFINPTEIESEYAKKRIEFLYGNVEWFETEACQ